MFLSLSKVASREHQSSTKILRQNIKVYKGSLNICIQRSHKIHDKTEYQNKQPIV